MRVLADIKTRRVEKFERYLKKRIAQGVTNKSRLYRDIAEQGYKGHPISVNRFVKNLRENIKAIRPSIRFETKPGEQAQVDWGSFGKIEINGRKERLSAFVYILGYSRMMFVEFTVRQNLQTLENCHIHAFEKLGIPKEIVYDNMKTVLSQREKLPDRKHKLHYHPGFLDFAQYYGFKITVCPPYWPRAKGKVEAAIKLLRYDFMQGLRFKKDFHSLDDLNEKVDVWLKNTIHKRKLSTVNEKRINRWKKEKKYLRFPRNFPPYQTFSFIERRVTKDGLVQYKLNFYSVPRVYARKKILLTEISKSGFAVIEIYFKNKMIATHFVSSDKGKWIVVDDHLTVDTGRALKAHSKKRSKNIKKEEFFRKSSYYNGLMPE